MIPIDNVPKTCYNQAMEDRHKTPQTTIRIPLADRNAITEYGRLHDHGTLNAALQAVVDDLVRPALAFEATRDAQATPQAAPNHDDDPWPELDADTP